VDRVGQCLPEVLLAPCGVPQQVSHAGCSAAVRGGRQALYWRASRIVGRGAPAGEPDWRSRHRGRGWIGRGIPDRLAAWDALGRGGMVGLKDHTLYLHYSLARWFPGKYPLPLWIACANGRSLAVAGGDLHWW
jgi:hypothetical protein